MKTREELLAIAKQEIEDMRNELREYFKNRRDPLDRQAVPIVADGIRYWLSNPIDAVTNMLEGQAKEDRIAAEMAAID